MISFISQLHSSDGLMHLIQSGGLWVIAFMVFSETGLLLGFFLPGDSLLITAGILSSPSAYGGGIFSPWQLAVTLIIAALLGDQVNYLLGRKTGSYMMNRHDGRLIKKRYFTEAHEFYETHGGKAIIFARFVPIIRTFVPFIAGTAQMTYRRYVTFSIFAAVIWVSSMVGIGYGLGQTPWAKKLHEVILIVIFVSLLPIVIGAIKRFYKKRRAPSDIHS